MPQTHHNPRGCYTGASPARRSSGVGFEKLRSRVAPDRIRVSFDTSPDEPAGITGTGYMGMRARPAAQGLYRPEFEHDSCGVGFIVHLKGQRSHKLVRDGLTALENLNHRGASGSEVNTGDGAGILIQIPHEFFRHECAPLGIRLPEAGHYGVGMFFAAPDERAREQAMALFRAIVEEEQQHLLGWRDVPTDNSSIGKTALLAEPTVHQVFVGRGAQV